MSWSHACKECHGMVYGQINGRGYSFMTSEEAARYLHDLLCPTCYPEQWDSMMDDYEARGLWVEWHMKSATSPKK